MTVILVAFCRTSHFLLERCVGVCPQYTQQLPVSFHTLRNILKSMLAVSAEGDLRAVVEQTVDALCFSATHCIDTDFRAHSADMVETVRSLQAEQSKRIEAAFKSTPPSAEYLAVQLVDLYSADAQNVIEAKAQNTPNVIDTMTEAAARVFKREMKMRIHDWEQSFKAATGRDPGPTDKAPLRSIYELYKAIKARISTGDSTGGPSFEIYQPPQPLATDVRGQPQPRGSTSVLTVPAAPTATTPSRSAVVSQQQSTLQSAAPQPLTAPRRPQSAGSGTRAIPPQSPPHQPRPQPGGALMTTLIGEKRQLKRALHQFEEEFEKQYGRKPTKADRKEHSVEYHRYGELKALLASNDD